MDIGQLAAAAYLYQAGVAQDQDAAAAPPLMRLVRPAIPPLCTFSDEFQEAWRGTVRVILDGVGPLWVHTRLGHPADITLYLDFATAAGTVASAYPAGPGERTEWRQEFEAAEDGPQPMWRLWLIRDEQPDVTGLAEPLVDVLVSRPLTAPVPGAPRPPVPAIGDSQ